MSLFTKPRYINLELIVPMHEYLLTYHDLSDYITNIYNNISEHNFREQKDKLIALRSHMAGLLLSREERRQLDALINDCFQALHACRDYEQKQFEADSASNYARLKPMVEQALAFAKASTDKRTAWDRCITVQAAFKGIKLKKELREELYQLLQQAFNHLKAEKDARNRQYEQDTAQDAAKLKATVDAAFERAKTSMEFKKTREALKRVQASFREVRLKPDDRQSLYSKLQAAFDMLNKRQDAYYLAKKDKIELHVNYQVADLGLRIEALQQEIEKDQQRIDELLETENNPLLHIETGNPSLDPHNQAKVLKAAIARKQELIDELIEQQSRIQYRLDKLEE